MAATDPAALLDAAVAMIEGARREGVEAMRREAIECCLAEYCDDGTAQKIEAAIVAVQVEKERTQ